MRLLLPSPLGEQILAEARAAAPCEACGLVEGKREAGAVRVSKLHRCANRAPCGRFEIDPAAHIALNRALRGRPTEIVGCYHSHPLGKAAPSRHDLFCGGPAGFVWLIAAGGELAAFEAPDFAPMALGAT